MTTTKLFIEKGICAQKIAVQVFIAEYLQKLVGNVTPPLLKD